MNAVAYVSSSRSLLKKVWDLVASRMSPTCHDMPRTQKVGSTLLRIRVGVM